MFTSILSSGESLTFQNAAICSGISLALGAFIAWIYSFSEGRTKNMVVSLALLPVIVQVVIMMVNGNLGAGVAVMGAFSLVRFRSVPGSSKEIVSIFFAMAAGLATGMGYVTFAVAFTLIVGLIMLAVCRLRLFGADDRAKDLRITIPENLDYTGVFDDLFCQYTSRCELYRVKTTNLGSMYELAYRVTLKDARQEKQMIDEIRCRNGNLPIICGRISVVSKQL